MGRRIHVEAGYALTDLKTNKENFNINDPRINPLGILGDLYKENTLDIWTREGFINFVKAKIDKEKKENGMSMLYFTYSQMMQDPKLRNWFHLDAITHDGEYGLPNILLIQPPELCEEWGRHDDTIDFHSQTELYGQKAHIIKSKRGIFPFQDFYFNTKTKKRVVNIVDKDLKNPNIKPIIPEGIQAFCEWGIMFTDPDTVFDLRPIIYYHWS